MGRSGATESVSGRSWSIRVFEASRLNGNTGTPISERKPRLGEVLYILQLIRKVLAHTLFGSVDQYQTNI